MTTQSLGMQEIMCGGNLYVGCIAHDNGNWIANPLKGGGCLGSHKRILVRLVVGFEQESGLKRLGRLGSPNLLICKIPLYALLPIHLYNMLLFREWCGQDSSS